MASGTKVERLKELQQIPGVGRSISEDLWNLGFRTIAQLRGKNPEQLYDKTCKQQGATIDRCLLYVYRCAIYYASHERHSRELLKWWNWSDENLKRRRRQ